MIAKFEKGVFWDKVHTSVCRYKNLHNLPHWHTEHELIFVSEGRAELMVNNSFFTLTAGMCAFVKGEEIHYIKSDAESVTGIVKMDAAYVKGIIQQKSLVCPVLSGDYAIDSVFSQMETELKEKKEYYDTIVDSIITKLVAEIFRKEETCADESLSAESDRKYKELLELIADSFAYITFEEAAAYMKLSKPYFSKWFQRISGMTFTRYLNMLKVTDAVGKILEGEMDMTQISISCGFGTIRNFNRVFKELTGYSPKQLPKNYVFIHNLKEISDNGFDPTLNCTIILEG